jgi:hypothetical protein
MPLRDHFRPPLDNQRHWEGFHGQWPGMIVLGLIPHLPERYFAEPRLHPNASSEIDVATFHEDGDLASTNGHHETGTGGVVTAVWAPPRPTLTLATDLPSGAEYAVRVYDRKRQCRLVASVEIVSPSNKDRDDHCQAFVTKCAALLQNRVSVIIVDLVTTRHVNLYSQLLDLLRHSDPAPGTAPEDLYAVACRATRQDNAWCLETWLHALPLGEPLPTLPLWLADDLAVPLELESSYELTCQALRIR